MILAEKRMYAKAQIKIPIWEQGCFALFSHPTTAEWDLVYSDKWCTSEGQYPEDEPALGGSRLPLTFSSHSAFSLPHSGQLWGPSCYD